MARMFRKDGGVDKRQSSGNIFSSKLVLIVWIILGCIIVYIAATMNQGSYSTMEFWIGKIVGFLIGALIVYRSVIGLFK